MRTSGSILHKKVALEECFIEDSSKFYSVINPKNLVQKRKNCKECRLHGCRKMHLIAVTPDGYFSTRNVLDINDNTIFNVDFNDDITELDDEGDNQVEVDDVENDRNDDGTLDKNVLFEVIEVGDYIGLRCPPKSIELFYVVQVLEKGIALNAMNTSSCLIHEGEPYVKVKYLEKTFEGKNGEILDFKNLRSSIC